MSEKRNYLVLVAASVDTAQVVRGARERLISDIDANAATLWVDSRGLGIFVSTVLSASEVWESAVGGKAMPFEVLKDVLVVEVGKDWATRRETKTEHWLVTHSGWPSRRPAG